jgi:L-alanine-DL-glutamate epimerase-like enolase superfamily enzyme
VKPVIDLRPCPLERPFAVSHMTTEAVDIIRLRLLDADGSEAGLGEISADPGYDQLGADIAREAAGLAGGCEVENVAQLRAVLEPAADTVSGPARTLVEMAWLDALARRAGTPVWRLLRLPDPGCVQLLHTVPLGEEIPACPLGPLKIKLGGAGDEETLGRLAGQAGPIILDVNRGWNRERWARLRPLVQRIAPAVLEDPVTEDALLAEVRAALPGTAVILDEGIGARAEVEHAARLSDGANIKVMKLGGILPAIDALAALATQSKTRMLGCFLEPPRSVAYAAQLNALCDWTDLDGHFWLTADPAVPAYRLDSSRPGIPEIVY